MANSVKYSTTGDTQSLKKGNIYLGVGDVGKGPSSATTYYNGVTPASSGYTVYGYNASQTSKISYNSPTNDAQLITYTNGISGQNFTGATECLNWYMTQNNYACVNMDYGNIITSGLIFNVDSGYSVSYTSSGVTWYDMSYSGNNGTLINGPVYDSANGGSISFDGVDDKVTFGTNISTANLNYPFTIECWVNADTVGNTTSSKGIFYTSNPVALDAYYGIGFGTSVSNDGTGRYGIITGIGTGASLGTTGRRSFATTNRDLTGGTWCHVVCTIASGPTFQIFVNGTIRSGSTSGTGSSTISWGSNTPTTIGQNLGSTIYFKGKVAVVRLYNSLLTQSEITQNFNALKTRFGL